MALVSLVFLLESYITLPKLLCFTLAWYDAYPFKEATAAWLLAPLTMEDAMIELRLEGGPLRVGVSALDFLWLVPSAPIFIIRLSRIGVPEFLGAKGE